MTLYTFQFRVVPQIIKQLATTLIGCGAVFFVDPEHGVVSVHRVTRFWLRESGEYGLTFQTAQTDATVYIARLNVDEFTFQFVKDSEA